MKVILLKDIKGLGRKFDEKEVSNGHALNFLIPNKLATPATGSNAGQIKSMKESAEAHKEAINKKQEENLSKLNGLEIIMKVEASEKNHLFASISKDKISEILKKEKDIDVDSNLLILSEPIKELGTFEIPLKSNSDKKFSFTLIINSK